MTSRWLKNIICMRITNDLNYTPYFTFWGIGQNMGHCKLVYLLHLPHLRLGHAGFLQNPPSALTLTRS